MSLPAWGSVLAADRHEAGQAERRIHADETDQDDFDNAHFALLFPFGRLCRPPMIEG